MAALSGGAAKAGRSLLARLAAAWEVYSRRSLAAQVHLTRLAGQALGHGRWLASLAGRTLLQLGGLAIRRFNAAAAFSREGAKAAAHVSRDLAGKGSTVGETALREAGRSLISFAKAALRWLSSAWRVAGSAATATCVAAGQRLVAARQKRNETTKTAASSDSGASGPAPESSPAAPAAAGTGNRPLPVAQPAAVKQTSPDQATSDRTGDERPGLLAAFRPAGLALGGLAAASIAFLLLAFGPDPAPTVARAALTFPLPEKPGAQSAPSPATVAETGPDAAVAGPTLTDPLDEMVAYVDQRRSAAADDGEAFLAEVEAVENLGQFLEAAEVVGLERLLEPDGDYTFLVPNDAAFAKLAPDEFDELLEPAGHERLLVLLSHHVLSERLTFDDLAGDVGDYTSLAGQGVTIDATDVIRVGDAGMVETDLPMENGILHVIDQVLPIDAP